jgi:hypothetical protein
MIVPILALASVFTPTSGWMSVDAVRATGFERVAGGQPHTFSIIRWKNRVALNCVRDLEGEYEGVLRTEVANDSGIYTWFAANPRWVLQISSLSAPEFAESTMPVRFTKSEITNDTQQMQRDLGKQIMKTGEDAVASRQCLVFKLSDSSPLQQSLWVDEQTGLALKQQDRVANDLVYERLLTSVQTQPQISPTAFDLPANATVIKGLVPASLLYKASRPVSSSQYDADLSAIKAGAPSKSWVLKLLVSSRYDYITTDAYESTEDPAPAPSDNRPPINMYASIGQIPAGWATPGGVAIFGRHIFFGYPAIFNNDPRDPSQQGHIVTPRAYYAPDGSLIRLVDDSPKPSTTAATPNPNPSDGKQHMIRSVFLDKKSGNTVTFYQLRDVSLNDALSGIRLSSPKVLDSPHHEHLLGYEMTKPMPLRVIAWQENDSEYVIASSDLSLSELQDLAEKS